MDSNDLKHLQELQKEHPDKVKKVVLEGDVEQAQITDSGSRPGFFILQTDTMEEMEELFLSRSLGKSAEGASGDSNTKAEIYRKRQGQC